MTEQKGASWLWENKKKKIESNRVLPSGGKS